MPRSIAGVAVQGQRVFVARRLPGGDLGGKWEFPGGKLEAGEDDRTALVREYQEEFGVEIEPLSLLGESGFVHNGKSYRLAAWLIRFLPGELTLLEHQECRWTGADDLSALDLADSDRTLLPFVLPLLR